MLGVPLVVKGPLPRLDLGADLVEDDVADAVDALLVRAVAVPHGDEVAVEADRVGDAAEVVFCLKRLAGNYAPRGVRVKVGKKVREEAGSLRWEGRR